MRYHLAPCASLTMGPGWEVTNCLFYGFRRPRADQPSFYAPSSEGGFHTTVAHLRDLARRRRLGSGLRWALQRRQVLRHQHPGGRAPCLRQQDAGPDPAPHYFTLGAASIWWIPGLRFAKAPEAIRSQWEGLIGPYLQGGSPSPASASSWIAGAPLPIWMADDGMVPGRPGAPSTSCCPRRTSCRARTRPRPRSASRIGAAGEGFHRAVVFQPEENGESTRPRRFSPVGWPASEAGRRKKGPRKRGVRGPKCLNRRLRHPLREVKRRQRVPSGRLRSWDEKFRLC